MSKITRLDYTELKREYEALKRKQRAEDMRKLRSKAKKK